MSAVDDVLRLWSDAAFECRCGRPATVNLQRLWVKWDVDPEAGGFSQRPEVLDIPQDPESIFLCKDCYEEWLEDY